MHNKQKKKTIMLLPPMVFPIPAVGGGAVEQLITHLLDVNEVENRAKFIVVSKYDQQAASVSYQNSEIFYLNQDGFVIGYERWFHCLWILYRLWLKLFHNRIVGRLFRRQHVRMDTYSFQCAILAKMKHVDAVVNELHDFGHDTPMTVFNKVVGSEHFYNHIHSVRKESLHSRRIINNSISISQYVRTHWVVDPSIPGKNEVLFNCIDVDKFRCNMPEMERFTRRQALGIQKDDFVVIFCGRLVPEKGVQPLMDVFDRLATSNSSIKLLLIGSAAFSNGNCTDFSKQISERAECNPNVIPLGYVPNAQLPEYYAIADAQVVPSTCQEGAGLVAIEGMSAGLPLIVTRSGGMTEYVGKSTSIQLSLDEDLPLNIEKAILRLANDPELCKTLGDAGKKRAGQFSRESYYNGFLYIVD